MNAPKPEWPQARSRLYRAISRAHLRVIAINKMVRGGLLEWVSRVQLKPGVGFDRDVERTERDPTAAVAAMDEAEKAKVRHRHKGATARKRAKPVPDDKHFNIKMIINE